MHVRVLARAQDSELLEAPLSDAERIILLGGSSASYSDFALNVSAVLWMTFVE
jgi:hypothetical protein